MPPHVVKGTIKVSIRGLAGVTVRIVKTELSGETEVGAAGPTDASGVFRIEADLETSSHYRVKLDHPDKGAVDMPLVVAPKLGAMESGLPVIVFNHTFPAAVDPFVQYKNQISKGDFLPAETSGSDYFYQVVTSDASSNTGLVRKEQVRDRLDAVDAKGTWTKDFDGVPHQLVKTANGLRWKSNTAPPRSDAPLFDLAENNRTAWDWLTWETEGNSDPKYQRGGKLRKLGLYKLDYDKLRKAGETRWKPVHTDHTTGGGWVKVATLKCLDYSGHEALIKTFLPCFRIEGGKVLEPAERHAPPISAPVSVTVSGTSPANAIDIAPPVIILPFNYDDNGEKSRALGRDLKQGALGKVDSKRLEKELERWATASRSTIAAFRNEPVNLTPKLDEGKDAVWPLRPASESSWKPYIHGTPTEPTLRAYQAEASNASAKYYSVKTGVQYVATVDQSPNGKDLLEENSIHAMNRSNLIKETMQRVGEGKFEGRYQVEVLCILIQKNPDGDAHYAAVPGELKNKDAASPDVERKKARIRLLTTEDEERNSEEIVRLEREIAEMLKPEEARIHEIKSGLGWDGIQVREISNAGATDIWFPALAIPSHGKAFAESWAAGQDWKEFWEANFAVPLGRAKAEMLLYFGMQHMTSNAQNFLIAFNRSAGGATGKLNHIILRDIGDTLYNDHVFGVLKDVDKSYADEWMHESTDPFGVTLQSSLGSYTMPRMLRIGASIVFFFEPFVKGDIEKLPDCFPMLSKWCIKHNRAFADYMKEKIGYREDWAPGPDAVDADLRDSISKFCELIKQNDIKYKILSKKILALNSTQRWKLVAEFEGLLAGVTERDRAKQLVNAHEALICADIQQYILSDAGKLAIRGFHGIPAPASAAAAAPSRKPVFNCSTCANVADTRSGWHKCSGCSKQYCPTCVPKMEKPRGFSSKFYTSRKCPACDDFTDVF